MRWGTRLALALGVTVLLAGGGLAVYGFDSRSSAEEDERARREELDAAREAQEDAEGQRDLDRSRLADAREAAEGAVRTGRPTLLIVEQLVENDADLLSLARRMRSAALAGQVSEFNGLVDDLNTLASDSNGLLRRLRRTLLRGP